VDAETIKDDCNHVIAGAVRLLVPVPLLSTGNQSWHGIGFSCVMCAPITQPIECCPIWPLSRPNRDIIIIGIETYASTIGIIKLLSVFKHSHASLQYKL